MKIYLHTYDERYKDRIAFIENIKSRLEKMGIIFVKSQEESDLILTQQVAYMPSLEEPLSFKKDTIILEVNDTACIFHNEIRKSLKSDYIKGIFKATNFFNLENHNKKTIGKRIHIKSVKTSGVYQEEDHDVILTEKELKKIKCALPSFLNFRMDAVRSINIDLEKDDWNKRDIIFNFAGTTNYKNNKNYVNLSESDPEMALPVLIGDHRKIMIENLIKKYKLQNGEKYLLTDNKPMSQIEYWRSLLNTKVCLSPWGFGAYNWRDYEAIYTGAVIIKPNTDFLETYCNLFKSNINYIACDQNFEDIIEKINFCKDENNINIIRKNALNLLKSENNLDKIAIRFKKQIEECLEK